MTRFTCVFRSVLFVGFAAMLLLARPAVHAQVSGGTVKGGVKPDNSAEYR
jgi:hypothetical protein